MKRGMTDTIPTRDRLISAAIDSFGHRGFDGTSIRDIARAAGVNIAGIAYHFGGKDQLYAACLKHIAQSMRQGLGAKLATGEKPRNPGEARRALKETLFAFTQFILGTPQMASFVRIVVREQLDPSPAFDILYGEFMEPLHKRLCALWAIATQSKAESEATKIAVFSLLGQVLLFRIARAGALRRMGWRDIGDRELKTLKKRIATNVDVLARSGPGGRQ
jgi:AcrR family transcriptional regulator